MHIPAHLFIIRVMHGFVRNASTEMLVGDVFMSLYPPANFASVFAKPFAILAVAVLLADPVTLEEQSRR